MMPAGPGYLSSLRVYEPLAAFSGAERRTWQSFVAQGALPDRRRGAELERSAALRAVLALPPTAAPAEPVEQAYVVVVDGITMVCPWRLRLRAWEALAAFRRGLPGEVADAFVPREVAEAAAAELARHRTAHPERRPHVVTSTWQVPLRWFVIFGAEERRLVLGRRRVGGLRGAASVDGPDRDRSLTYFTTMSRARRRLARALAVLRRTIDDGPVVSGVAELGRWLEEFHPRSVVELDYGGLVHLLRDDALRQDESVREVTAVLRALADGDTDEAAASYQRVTDRWQALQALESAN